MRSVRVEALVSNDSEYIMPIKKGQKLSDGHKNAISDGLKRAVQNGYLPANTKNWKAALSCIDDAAMKKRAETFSKKMKGKPQPMETVVGRHENNIHAKEWRFVNKSLGVVLEGKNLNRLVRDNEHLFDKKYLNWDKCGCTASRCLRGLTSKRTKSTRPRGSWNGWMI